MMVSAYLLSMMMKFKEVIMKVLSSKRAVKGSEGLQHVAQIQFDIVHDGDYDMDAFVSAIENLGYEVLGSDATDVTDQYGY